MVHTLPGLLILTEAAACPRPLVEQAALAAAAGARAFVLREKQLSQARRRELADRLTAAVGETGARVIVADPSWDVEACHLSAHAEVPSPRPNLVGRSSHAADHGVPDADYVTFSPIYRTASKPGYGPALGVRALSHHCAASLVPVFALGGIDSPRRAAECRRAGAHGVAVMGAVMRAPDPGTVVRELLAAVGQPT